MEILPHHMLRSPLQAQAQAQAQAPAWAQKVSTGLSYTNHYFYNCCGSALNYTGLVHVNMEELSKLKPNPEL